MKRRVADDGVKSRVQDFIFPSLKRSDRPSPEVKTEIKRLDMVSLSRDRRECKSYEGKARRQPTPKSNSGDYCIFIVNPGVVWRLY